MIIMSLIGKVQHCTQSHAHGPNGWLCFWRAAAVDQTQCWHLTDHDWGYCLKRGEPLSIIIAGTKALYTQNTRLSTSCQKVVIFLDDNHKVVLVTTVLTTRWQPFVLCVNIAMSLIAGLPRWIRKFSQCRSSWHVPIWFTTMQDRQTVMHMRLLCTMPWWAKNAAGRKWPWFCSSPPHSYH